MRGDNRCSMRNRPAPSPACIFLPSSSPDGGAVYNRDVSESVDGMLPWRPGDVVLERLHTGATGKLISVRAAYVVEDTAEHLVLYFPRESTYATADNLGGQAGRYRLPIPERVQAFVGFEPAAYVPRVNDRWHVLYLLPPDAWHAVWIFWDADWRVVNWYVNLQRPFVRTAQDVSNTDLYLDLILTPDLQWAWKDLDEFDGLCEAGVFSDSERTRILAEAAKVARRIEAREPPFDAQWAGWRPDPSWGPLNALDYWSAP